MSMRMIPFKSKKEQPKTDLPKASALIKSKDGPKLSQDGMILESGMLGNLNYEIYKRGVIKIFGPESDSPVFKKDINLFENEVKRIDFGQMSEGQDIMIRGSGDNDSLVFSRINGDIQITLKKRSFAAIELLTGVLSKGKEKLLQSKADAMDKVE